MSDSKELDGMSDTSKGDKEGRKKTILLYVCLIATAIIVVLIVPFLAPINPGVSGSSAAKVSQMGRLTAKIGRLENDVRKKQNELFNILNEYSQRTNEPPPALNGIKLSDDEKKTLKSKIVTEKNPEMKSLLKDILDVDSKITGLRNKMREYEALLPKPHIATKEENHFQIVMEFLMKEKKLKKERALWLVERTVLFDPMISGFRVWNFYSGDEFRSFVTQGNADISPNELKKVVDQYLIDLRDRALAEKEKLTTEINKLTSTKDQLTAQVSNLQDEAQKMTKNLKNMSRQNLEMQRVINSLFYMVDLEKSLIKRGIIKDAFLGFIGPSKLKEILPEYFDQKIDLRKTSVIEINTNQFNLSKIKKVTVYPKFYKRGVDYKVEIEKNEQKAILTILTIEKFRSERVVIAVE